MMGEYTLEELKSMCMTAMNYAPSIPCDNDTEEEAIVSAFLVYTDMFVYIEELMQEQKTNRISRKNISTCWVKALIEFSEHSSEKRVKMAVESYRNLITEMDDFDKYRK